MNSHARIANIRGNRKERQPQVFDISIAESAFNRLIKISTAEHRRDWVRQVKKLPPPLRHFLQ